MTDDPRAIRDRAEATLAAGGNLRSTKISERAEWLAAAAEAVLADVHEARGALADTTGLSAPMVEWGARTTLSTVQPDVLCAVANEASAARGSPVPMLSLVLAGNLFTASVRAIVVPLLLGVPVLAKASSREILFPNMFKDALRHADPKLGEAVDLVVFLGGDVQCEDAFVERASALAVYGSDETIDAIRARHPKQRLIAHGHGVSAAYCGPDALRDDRIHDSIEALSLDICAYDQRGCLSPQVVYVDETRGWSALEFAERLASEGLDPLSEALPRGPLPIELGAAQAQWRGVAEVEGTLFAGNDYSIAVRPARSVRWSPAYRNVNVAGVRGLAEAIRAMRLLGDHLKCVGASAGSLVDVHALLEQDPALGAYACPLGTMQTPPFDAPADGHPIWHGLLHN